MSPLLAHLNLIYKEGGEYTLYFPSPDKTLEEFDMLLFIKALRIAGTLFFFLI